MFAGQSERDGIAEIDREGDGVNLGNQDSLAPFMHCLCQGSLNGFVELVFHAGTVSCPDGHRQVHGCFHLGSGFLVWRLMAASNRATVSAAQLKVEVSEELLPSTSRQVSESATLSFGRQDGLGEGGVASGPRHG